MKRNLKLKELSEQLTDKKIEEQLSFLAAEFSGKIIFTTSFGIEDQVITDIIFKNDIKIEVVTLDTGRLFQETYEVFSQTILKYNKKIKVYFPDHEDIEKMVTEKGPVSFLYSPENRLECCKLRKVKPLNRALLNKECWISGIRADQSDNRGNMDNIEFDAEKNMIKFHPLLKWSLDDVMNYIHEHNIPYNMLHDKGFLSIGCEPCTRAVAPGEDFRAGRWWWENEGPRECGLHLK